MTAPDTTDTTATTETPAAPLIEQRSHDQDAAIEEAFIAGTLPEKDRRAPEPDVIPIPFSPTTPHLVDNLPPGTTITKSAPDTITISGPTGLAESRTLEPDDALHHLPVGATIDIGMPGATAATIKLPATATRLGPVTSLGSRVHEALAAIWHWIATEA